LRSFCTLSDIGACRASDIDKSRLALQSSRASADVFIPGDHPRNRQ
jgi:hypothetical protein